MSATRRAAAWDDAPCALLTLDADGLVVDANATFLAWTGRERSDVVAVLRLGELLTVGGRIYWETHLAPILHVEGHIDEVALELRTAGGRLPVLLSARVDARHTGTPPSTHIALTSARERSRYERELLAARREAEAAAETTRVLLAATSALSAAVGVDGVVGALLGSVRRQLGGSAATYWSAEPRQGLVARDAVGEDAADAPRPHLSQGLAAGDAHDQGDRIVVPVRTGSRLQGALSIAPGPGTHPPPDLPTLTAVGQHAGMALERARLYEASRDVAHRLQQALLADEPPADPRFSIAASYRPGVESLEVGGDWHDAFIPDREVLAVCVGDVVGRGLAAAIAMGQLRSAVRALAGPGVGPAALLDALDRFVEHVEDADTATVVFAQVALATGRVSHACAGHLPPLLIPADGAARPLWSGRSTPLGVLVPGVPRPQAEVVLRPGDRLLLYTDGLVERRDRSLTQGLVVLTEAVAEVRGKPPEEVVAHLMSRLLVDEHGRDDVCVLLLAWHGADGPR